MENIADPLEQAPEATRGNSLLFCAIPGHATVCSQPACPLTSPAVAIHTLLSPGVPGSGLGLCGWVTEEGAA